MSTLYAHSRNVDGERHSLDVHLRAVADLAASFAAPFGGDDLARWAGLAHDLGKAGERFFYIDIGSYAGQQDTQWSRRLKVPLNLITWDLIKSGKVLAAKIPGTGKDGGPSCAYEWRKRVDPSWNWRPEK